MKRNFSAATLVYCFLTVICQPQIIASEYNAPSEGIQENDTFSVKAEALHYSASRQNVEQLARDAVNTCYDAYAQNFSANIRQERARLAGQGRSSYYQLIPGIVAKSFAEAIINQLSTLAPKIPSTERNMFWDTASNLIKSKMTEFCKGHGSNSSPDLDSHIDSLIKMKKTFG